MAFDRRAWIKEWKKRNKDKLAAQARERRRKDPDPHREINQKWMAENKERRREYRRQYRANNLDKFREYDRQKWLREKKIQDELATRPRPESCEFGCGRGPVVYDHDHATKQFRSWPCKECNTAMGLAGDNPEILRKMADLIDKHRVEHGH